jgi:hypothetical protein
VLRAVLPKYPHVRLVFKDFPLETIHPWAVSASITWPLRAAAELRRILEVSRLGLRQSAF